MAAGQPPLVTRAALLPFTRRLVAHFSPDKGILFCSLARGAARWESNADPLVLMPFEGRPRGCRNLPGNRSPRGPDRPLQPAARLPAPLVQQPPADPLNSRVPSPAIPTTSLRPPKWRPLPDAPP